MREARPWVVMTGYNRLNGVYCSQHPWLLRDVLRGEWGFDGAVVSDWGAMSESVASVAAGLDVCMPGPRADHSQAVEGAVLSGSLSLDALDEAACRVSCPGAKKPGGEEPLLSNAIMRTMLK